jgi:hypothetical protein
VRNVGEFSPDFIDHSYHILASRNPSASNGERIISFGLGTDGFPQIKGAADIISSTGTNLHVTPKYNLMEFDTDLFIDEIKKPKISKHDKNMKKSKRF